jgi:hypothetical protein
LPQVFLNIFLRGGFWKIIIEFFQSIHRSIQCFIIFDSRVKRSIQT